MTNSISSYIQKGHIFTTIKCEECNYNLFKCKEKHSIICLKCKYNDDIKNQETFSYKFKKFTEVLKNAPSFCKDTSIIHTKYLNDFNFEKINPTKVDERMNYEGYENKTKNIFRLKSEEEKVQKKEDFKMAIHSEDDINSSIQEEETSFLNENNETFSFIDEKTSVNEFLNLSNVHENEMNLKEQLIKICISKGFKISKNWGKNNDSVLVYFCEYGGRKRESELKTVRKKKSKKFGKIFYIGSINLIKNRLSFSINIRKNKWR